jgi:hypothetical protein
MQTDTVLRCEGMKILAANLGIVEAERFVALILREPFDYTEWRKGLFENMSLDTFLANAQRYSESLERKNA